MMNGITGSGSNGRDAEPPRRVRATGGSWFRAAAVWIVTFGAMASSGVRAADDRDDPWSALPPGERDAHIPTPESYFGRGFRIGGRHLRHHELLAYLDELDRASDRVQSFEYARSHEGRPLKIYVVTHPARHGELDEVLAARRRWRDASASGSSDSPTRPPLAVFLGATVHGNEASGANAVPLVAYHLAASQSSEVLEWLERSVMLLDPCLNPDGYDRFTSWVNQHRGRIPRADPFDREHRESWPGGRSNAYWFDLNRDWLPAQHPETQGRLRIFREWRPNVALDFHEMGTASTYFFQPGAPRRKHPRIPDENVRLTREIGSFHAKILDEAGSLYYTEESFDDFYPGKGSTYVDLRGGVGILFEQASSRGVVQERENGKLTFGFTVRNQVFTALSSLRGAMRFADALHDHQRAFYAASRETASPSPVKAHLFRAAHDPMRLAAFRDLLARHGIACRALNEDMVVNGTVFARADSLLVPAVQTEATLLESLIERRTQFEESVFYDVSAWSVPLAFHLDHAAVEEDPNAFSRPDGRYEPPRRAFAAADGDVAYLIDWRGYFAPRTLHRLLRAGIGVRAARKPVTIATAGGPESFEAGALMVPIPPEPLPGSPDSPNPTPSPRAAIERILKAAAETDGVRVASATSFLTPEGPDLGSNQFVRIAPVSAAVVTGPGIRSSEAGEVWHLLENRYQIPVTLLDMSDLGAAPLDRYTAIVLPSGRYADLSESTRGRIKAWIDAGGTLVAVGSAGSWLAETQWVALKTKTRPKSTDAPERRPFDAAESDSAVHRVAGAILRTELDTTHPLCYGIAPGLPVMRDHATLFEAPAGSLSSPVVYAAEPLMSGYVSRDNIEALKGSGAVIVRTLGNGRAILLVDNPNFRAFWYGSNRLFLNALFFGPTLRASGSSDSGADSDD